MCTLPPSWLSKSAWTSSMFLLCLTLWEQWLRGTWCSGITSASHGEGPGLNTSSLCSWFCLDCSLRGVGLFLCAFALCCCLKLRFSCRLYLRWYASFLAERVSMKTSSMFLLCLTLWEQWLRGTWCSGVTSASHAEGLGLSPQCVHAQHAAC